MNACVFYKGLALAVIVDEDMSYLHWSSSYEALIVFYRNGPRSPLLGGNLPSSSYSILEKLTPLAKLSWDYVGYLSNLYY